MIIAHYQITNRLNIFVFHKNIYIFDFLILIIKISKINLLLHYFKNYLIIVNIINKNYYQFNYMQQLFVLIFMIFI